MILQRAQHVQDWSRLPVVLPGEVSRPRLRALVVSAVLVGLGFVAGLACGGAVGCGGCGGALLAILGGVR